VARQFGTEHQEMVVRRTPSISSTIWSGISRAVRRHVRDPTFMVSRLAAQSVKVVLSGDGGDELFAGYDKYVVEGRERQAERLLGPVPRRSRAAGDGLPGGRAAAICCAISRWPAPRATRRLDPLPSRGPGTAVPARAVRAPSRRTIRGARRRRVSRERGSLAVGRSSPRSRAYLPLDILTKGRPDEHGARPRGARAAPRHRLVEFAANDPARLALHDGVTKSIFKDAPARRPARRDPRTSQAGVRGAARRWFRGRLDPLVRDLLLSERCRSRGFFHEPFIADLLARHARGRDLDAAIWTLISFEMWCRRFLDAPPAWRPRGRRRSPCR